MAKANATTPTLTAEQITRFWSYVNKDGPNGCWVWTGGTHQYGYGMFHPKHGQTVTVHRLAWILLNGPILNGLHVLHNCPGGDNPVCCNPEHCFLGTHADNLRDAFAKGRMANRDANPVCKETKHGNAVLTDTDVVAMRREYTAGGITQRALAKKYGITQPNLWAIIHRKTWSHVPDESASDSSS